MSDGNDIGYDEALAIFQAYAPMLDRFGEDGVDYCVVGVLRVMLQGLAKDSDAFRMVRDLDIVIGSKTSAASILDSCKDAFTRTDNDQMSEPGRFLDCWSR